MARASLKNQIRNLLEEGDLDQVAEVATARRRTLGQLVSLTFDSDPTIVYRAIEATGVCAGRLAKIDPDSVWEHLRRLLWMISEESGGICWHAPELMAEIVHRLPDQFSEYLEVTASFLLTMEEEDLEHFRPAALRALGLLGEIPGDLRSELMPAVTAALDSPDAQARGMAVWALSRMGETDLISGRKELLSDDGEVDHYHDGRHHRTTIADLTRSLLDAVG